MGGREGLGRSGWCGGDCRQDRKIWEGVVVEEAGEDEEKEGLESVCRSLYGGL